MICRWCAIAADGGFPGRTHQHFYFSDTELGEFSCKGGTHCDCQHKEPGTAINKDLIDANQPD